MSATESSAATKDLGREPFEVQNRARDLAILATLAGVTVIVHAVAAGRYGFHRDELATLDDARHLAWGYVAYPPVTPFFARISLMLFGTSLSGFRFFAAVAQAVAVVLTGLMARELGGRIGAQLVAAAAAVPFCLAAGALMQYVSFDYLFWVATAYFVVRLLKSDDPHWWIAIGASIGVGMLAKYGMAFFALALAVGLLLTPARHYLWSKWLWLGLALSLLIFLPNAIWQAQHHFISLDFLRYIHARDVRIGRTKDFLPDQLELTLLAFPLAVAGLFYYLFSTQGRRFRMLGWMYVVPLALFVAVKGRGYYLAAAYPMLYASGSTWGEQLLARMRARWANLARGIAWAALTLSIALAAAVTIPMTEVNSRWWGFAAGINDGLVEEIGWPELAATVAQIRDALPANERSRLGVLTGNYGEAGAINLYGPQYGLPAAISGTNSFWARGYGDPAPERVIVLGLGRRFLDEHFGECRAAGRISNAYSVENEETLDHPEIFLCGPPRAGWIQFWKGFQRFG